ncbi:hypothetical protein TNCT_355631 [Trichonephila clavata]|uniref:Uncharacterized protein n=1 Tax=Trichonephila clavata TaxID=2740835 RepID=A0A8X6GTV7_TRICU|nr:hypothetical protein TNCT_355631 [Trichonephila clavata]
MLLASGRPHPHHHPGMDNGSDLAVHSSRLAVDHEEGILGRGGHVRAKHARAYDGAVAVAPGGQSGVGRTADASDHLNFAIREIHKEDVLFGRRRRVQIVGVRCPGRKEGHVTDLERRLHIE